MQRRAAVAYVVLFVVLGVGSYAFASMAATPTVSIDDPDETLEKGNTFTVDDREYNVTDLQPAEEGGGGGGHGGGGGSAATATVAWINESALHTETWEQDGTVDIDNTTYVVDIPNASDPSEFQLREEAGEDIETIERNGTTYVVEQRNDTEVLVPIDEYEGLDRANFSEGDEIDYNGNATTIENVSADRVLVQWQHPAPVETEITDGSTVELNGQEYVAHFADDETVQLSTDVGSYEQQVEEKHHFEERMAGFRGVAILSGIAIILLLAMAFLPRKDT